MTDKTDAMSPQLKALKTTDLSPLINMSGLMLPRIFPGMLAILDEKQRGAFDKVMPVGGKRKIYTHLADTPTPPIVIQMAQPPKITTMPEDQVNQQKIKGIRLTLNDLQLVMGGRSLGNMLKLMWQLKGQMFTMFSIMGMFGPFIWLGPAELKDMQKKITTHFKPMLDLMPH
jgi:hypothetical protein